jgi:hypothetical protein
MMNEAAAIARRCAADEVDVVAKIKEVAAANA